MTVRSGGTAYTAEQESERALKSVFDALDGRQNFKLDAGAGAGKTYSLIAALERILADRKAYLPRADQQVACLTYTKVARDEIIKRTDASPHIFADTLHGFLWEMIGPYQKALAPGILAADEWQETLGERTSINGLEIEYDLGIRSISNGTVRLHHDDVPRLALQLFSMPKFRTMIADRFPIIFIDEYQDTPRGLVEAMLGSGGTDSRSPVFGFFGDDWQQIYDETCGSIQHSGVVAIPKNANFRSGSNVVGFLNNLRPELTQAPAADARQGTVTVYHTNEWPGSRLGRNWKGQISHIASHNTLEWVLNDAKQRLWTGSTADTKTLMLTHSSLANELGYASLPTIFKYNDSFAKKEDQVIAFLLDVVEPACQSFRTRRYGELFDVLGRSQPHIKSHRDKREWSDFFIKLDELRRSGTVGDVLDHVLQQKLFSVPGSVSRRQTDLELAITGLASGETMEGPRRTVEYKALRDVSYAEISALDTYVNDKTIFSTKHNVKGAEFDNVLVVLGRGWSKYDFAKMLANHTRRDRLDDSDRKSFERSRNLFYVAVSRAKTNLVLLFTQELTADALSTLEGLAGSGNILSIEFANEASPVNAR